MLCLPTVMGAPAVDAHKPSAAIASRADVAAFSTMYVPAGYSTLPSLNDFSATLTFAPPTFHGRTADRQSPRCLTRSVPVAGTVPLTLASAVSSCIGRVRIVESETLI